MTKQYSISDFRVAFFDLDGTGSDRRDSVLLLGLLVVLVFGLLVSLLLALVF